MATEFAVIGDGAMGTACALLLAKQAGQRVTVWSQFPDHAAELSAARENRRYLPGVPIPASVRITADFAEAAAADAFVVAVPTIYLASVLERLRGGWPAGRPVVSVVKGIEQRSGRFPSQIVAELLAGPPVAVLSGPSHAEEIARGMPASVVAASGDIRLAREVQRWFSNDRFRVYTSHDVLGTELAAALKNVIAVAAGICDGLGFGDNAKSALMTRGLVEMVRCGAALGAEPDTFYGLAGMGDLVTTCISPHGRNRRVGERIGRGERLAEILGDTAAVAEGVWTSRSVHELATAQNLDLPVSREVYLILHEGKDPLQAVQDLMSRGLKPERD